jgi:hypothetical protein
VPELADLLGQGVTAEQLSSNLKRPGVRSVRLTGPPGSGKSHIARLVARTWLDEGGGCVVAVGDNERSWRTLYPLLSGLSQVHGDWVGLASKGTRSALQVADSALGGAGVGTSIFDLLGAAFRQRIERVLKPYSSLERDVILDLKRLARSRRILVVADNTHWWDADSLRLLRDVLGDPLREAIPRLNSVVALIVDTADEQPVTAPDPFRHLVADCEDQIHRTARCTRQEFGEVLKSFGLNHDLPEDVVRTLFDVTDGHLKLAEQVAAYAEYNSVGSLIASVDDSYLATLVRARFASLGAFSPNVTDLLLRAAILGLSFSEQDLLCMSEGKRTALRTLIQHAESIGFIERIAGQITFSHEVIRAAILGGQPPVQLDALYSKLSECLATLRPGDYGARAQALLQAGDPDAARDMIALSSIAELRRGAVMSRVRSRVALQFPEDHELETYLELIASAYSAIGSGDYSAPLPGLRTPLSSETTLMAAERNYLAALCLMELQTAACVAESRTILSTWMPTLQDEVELSLRFMLLLQQAQVLSEMFDEARITESTIEQRLLDRVRYDADAAVTLQIQNRRAGAVNVPEIAELRIAESVAFFKRGTSDTSRDQLELFRSLNNLAAIELRLGKDNEAHDHAQEAERIALESPDVVQRIDVVASNLVLASHRSGMIDATEAVARQLLIIDSPDGSNDKFIHRCNLVAYLLLASQDDTAASELEGLVRELENRGFDESYLVFYSSALSVARYAVGGHIGQAIERNRKLGPFVESLKWPCAAHIRRRQRLLDEFLPAFRPNESRLEADRLLLDARPSEVGPGWSYYARLFPCCELSFWSDS